MTRRFLNKGFTFAEVLLATAILAFSLSALLAAFIGCMLLNEANRNLSIAASHAQYVAEEIKDTDFSSVSSGITNGAWDWDSSDITDRNLTALKNESIATEAAGTDPLKVTVTVSWQDRPGRDRQMVLETLFTEQ